MKSNLIKLSILGISFSQVQAGAYALIFAEENGIRRLPIVIGTPEAQSIAIVMEGITPPRPLSHDLICSIFKELGIQLIEVVIHKFEDGAFFSELLLEQNGKEYRIDSRTSDAVAIAIRTGSPIYTTRRSCGTWRSCSTNAPPPRQASLPLRKKAGRKSYQNSVWTR